MADSVDERTEAPTPKKRNEARKKGNVARSTEINSVLVLFISILFLKMLAPWIYKNIFSLFNTYYSMVSNTSFSDLSFINLFRSMLLSVAKIVLPVMAAILTAGLLANYLQIGFLFTTEPLTPKLEKINPLSGFKRMFSMRSIVEMVKSIMKLSVIAIIAYITITEDFLSFLKAVDATVGGVMLLLLNTAFKLFFRTSIIFIFLGLIDYAYQKYEHEKNLRMTKQEIKDEHKQLEGDPKIKSRIKSLQREMARRRMMEEVPKATVVVTNPTFLAIAIRYVPGEMETPAVVAKGKRVIAEKIKEVASEAQIPIVEDKPLARAMYDRVEPGDDIPVEFYSAVAEIMAYVFRLQNRNAA